MPNATRTAIDHLIAARHSILLASCDLAAGRTNPALNHDVAEFADELREYLDALSS